MHCKSLCWVFHGLGSLSPHPSWHTRAVSPEVPRGLPTLSDTLGEMAPTDKRATPSPGLDAHHGCNIHIRAPRVYQILIPNRLYILSGEALLSRVIINHKYLTLQKFMKYH